MLVFCDLFISEKIVDVEQKIVEGGKVIERSAIPLIDNKLRNTIQKDDNQQHVAGEGHQYRK